MAKILVLTFTNMPGGVLDAFRQGFVEALARLGNDVLVLRSNDFLSDYQNSNLLSDHVDAQMLLDYIRDFEPEAVFSMNHSGMFPGLAAILDCPIGVWLLDGPSYLVEQEECRRQNARYHMFVPVRVFRQDLTDGFGFGNGNVHYLPFASDFEARQLPFERNVAFVGTFFTGWRLQKIIEKSIHNRGLLERIRALIDSYADNRDALFPKRLHDYGLDDVFTDDFDEAYILNTIAINRRIRILDAVQDLGLSVYGTTDWPSVMPFSSGLALSFNPLQVTAKEGLEEIYSGSKININVSHAQARGGLPWRVFDVMSSSGVLVSDYQEDLELLFGAEVKIPIYHSPSEARELCVQLLNDEVRRADLAQSCQSVIDKGHRFKHRIQTLSEVLGLNLLPGGSGAFRFLDPELFKTKSEDEAAPSSPVTFNTQPPADVDSISLQIFQSKGLVFDARHSQLAHLTTASGGALHHQFVVPASLRYIRLDVGECYSRHIQVALTVAPLQQGPGKEITTKVIDLTRDVIDSNQFLWNGSTLSCGFDAYCVFKNPYPGGDVVVTFNSMIESRI